jgi:hypothetical protein
MIEGRCFRAVDFVSDASPKLVAVNEGAFGHSVVSLNFRDEVLAAEYHKT